MTANRYFTCFLRSRERSNTLIVLTPALGSLTDATQLRLNRYEKVSRYAFNCEETQVASGVACHFGMLAKIHTGLMA